MIYPSLMTIVLLGGSAFLLSLGITLFVRRWALRRGLVDRPEDDPNRKIHRQPIPLMGGAAIAISFGLVVVGYALFSDRFLAGYLMVKHVVGLLLGVGWLMIGGYLDDRQRLSPAKQLIWPLLAALTIVVSGIGVDYISNPFGEAINLRNVSWTLFTFHGLPYGITLAADAFTVLWLMGMMYTTKFLDGLDGLVTGLGAIGSVIVFILSLRSDVAQPETALLAIILAGALLGFLVWNFHPAKIFLGEGGSLLVGFLLGVLSIISGGKIATALLIMGIPILDVAWVIVRRLFTRRSVASADRKHLHFRLLDAGLSQRTAVLLLYGLTIAFGITGLLVQGQQKALALVILAGSMILLGIFVVVVSRRRQPEA